MALIYLVELTVYDPGLAATKVLRYCDGLGYSDSSAPGFYEGRLSSTPAFFAAISADPTKAGPQITGGQIVLKNDDRGLEAVLMNMGMLGQPFVVLVGDSDGVYGDFEAVMSGTMQKPAFTYSPARVSIPVNDRSQDLQKPLGNQVFAGSNTGSTGTEGYATDLLGTHKPVCYGKARMCFGPYVNTVRPIQQLHDNVINNILAGYDKGVLLTKGVSRTFANIDSASDPTALNYDYHLGADGVSGAYTRRATTDLTAGPIVYVIEGDKRGGTYRTTVADIVKEILGSRLTGGPPTVAGDVTALNAAAAGVVGFFNRDDVMVSDAVNKLIQSAGAKWWIDSAGNFRMAQLAAPSSTHVVDFRRFTIDTAAKITDADIVSFQLLAPDVDRVWKLSVLYQPFWTVQTDGLDANISQDLRSQLSLDFRSTAPASDASILTADPGAIEVQLETMLDSESDATALRDILFPLLSVRRDTVLITARLDADTAALVDIGDSVGVYDIFDYGSAGRDMSVMGRGFLDRRQKLLQFKVGG